MNEIQFLRDQVSLERRHMSAVTSALEAALRAPFAEHLLRRFCSAAAGYLVFVLERGLRQDAKHAELLLGRLPAENAGARARVADAARALAGERSGLEPLARALAASADPASPAAPLIAACRDYLTWFNTQPRHPRHTLHDLADAHYRVEEWRAATFIDADSILEERDRYAAVERALPPGIGLDVTAST